MNSSWEEVEANRRLESRTSWYFMILCAPLALSPDWGVCQRLYRVEGDCKLELLDELELASGEDAPMSMDADGKTKRVVCGINSSLDSLETTKNQNCRKFVLDDGKCVCV